MRHSVVACRVVEWDQPLVRPEKPHPFPGDAASIWLAAKFLVTPARGLPSRQGPITGSTFTDRRADDLGGRRRAGYRAFTRIPGDDRGALRRLSLTAHGFDRPLVQRVGL